MSPAQALAAPGTVTVIDGLRGPIVEREVPCHAGVEAKPPPWSQSCWFHHPGFWCSKYQGKGMGRWNHFLAIPFRDLLQLANWKSPFEIVNNRTKWAIFQRYVKLLERKTNYVV